METKSIQKTIAELNASFSDRMALFEAQLSQTSSSPTTLTSLASEFSTFKAFIKGTLNNLQSQIDVLVSQVDSLEMRSRRKMLLLHGVAEQKQEETSNIVANILKSHLKLQDFNAASIKRCHRMGRFTDGDKPRSIAVKFETVSMRDSIWYAKTKFKGTGITISEFLTKQRHQVFMAARDKFGITNSWTKEGFIYITTSAGVRHRLSSLIELNKIEPQDAEKPVAPAKAAAKSKRTVTKK